MTKITDKTVKSKYPPKQTNVTWIDTSEKLTVIKSFIDGKWVVVGGGVTDYNDIKNKPTINGVELDGNKTSSDLGLATSQQGTKADNAIPMPTGGSDEQILAKDSNETAGVKWVPKPQDGEDGASAYDLYVDSVPSGQTPMTQEQWLASLKANIGAFKFVNTIAAVQTQFETDGVGSVYTSSIDGVTADVTTLSVILLMTTSGLSTEKTYMIATQDDGSSGYEFVYAGDLQSAMPSNVLTENDVDNTHLVNPVSGALAKAEDAMQLLTKLEDVDAKDTKVVTVKNGTGQNAYADKFLKNDGKIAIPSNTTATQVDLLIVDCTGFKKVRFLGAETSADSMTMSYGFASTQPDPTNTTDIQVQISDLKSFDTNAGVKGAKEYVVDIPEGKPWFVCTIAKYFGSTEIMSFDDFYCYKRNGYTAVSKGSISNDLMENKNEGVVGIEAGRELGYRIGNTKIQGSVVSGRTFAKYFRGNFVIGDKLRLTMTGDVSLTFVVRNDVDTTLGTITCNGDPLDITIDANTSYIMVYLYSTSVTSSGNVVIVLDSGFGLEIDAVKASLNSKQSISNLVSDFQSTPDNTHYPSEKLVKDNFDKIFINESVVSDMTSYGDPSKGYVMNSDGGIAENVNTGYKLMKLEIDENNAENVFNCDIHVNGIRISLAYGFDENDTPVERYYLAQSTGNHSFEIKNISQNVSYILFQKYGDSLFRVDKVSYGEILENLKNGIESDGGKIYEHIIHISPAAVGQNSLIGTILSLIHMPSDDPVKPSYYHRYTLELEAGTYDIDVSSSEDPSVTTRGITLPAYTTIKGVSKSSTILVFRYTGNSDTVMSEYSGFTIYNQESNLENLTIIVKNIRYAIHGFPNTSIVAKTNTFKNIKLIHEGFDEGLSPTYKIPIAWASGNGYYQNYNFENCDFDSYQACAWYNHDQISDTSDCTVSFSNCTFLNRKYPLGYAGTTYNYYIDNYINAAIVFNSYGAQNHVFVYMNNCKCNNFVKLGLSIPSGGNPNGKVSTILITDGSEIIDVTTQNDSNKEYHFQNSNCKWYRVESSSDVQVGTPMIIKSEGLDNTVIPFDGQSTEDVVGIITHNISNNNYGCVICGGTISQNLLGVSTFFTTGKKIGFNGTTWVEDNNNPILIATSLCTAKFIK